MPHYILQEIDPDSSSGGFPDLKAIERFQPQASTPAPEFKTLCQITSSALLTFFLPEISTSRRQETEFLSSSHVLWNLLTVNCIRTRNSLSTTTAETTNTASLAPVSQFIAAIHNALQTQRADEAEILRTLQSQLVDSDDGTLFDDQEFTKSHLYHWAVKTCDTVCFSVATTLQLLEKFSEDFIAKTMIKESGLESSDIQGVTSWPPLLAREVAELNDLREEFLACRQSVQERVSFSPSMVLAHCFTDRITEKCGK